MLLLSVQSRLDLGTQECDGSSLQASAPLLRVYFSPQVSLQLTRYRAFIAHPFPVRSDRKNLHLKCILILALSRVKVDSSYWKLTIPTTNSNVEQVAIMVNSNVVEAR